jgi:hypothetical protein
MARHHRTVHAPSLGADGVSVPAWEELVAFTPEEETARDAEEVDNLRVTADRIQATDADLDALETGRAKLAALGLTDIEIAAILRAP